MIQVFSCELMVWRLSVSNVWVTVYFMFLAWVVENVDLVGALSSHFTDIYLTFPSCKALLACSSFSLKSVWKPCPQKNFFGFERNKCTNLSLDGQSVAYLGG